jgi:hypothetical protein
VSFVDHYATAWLSPHSSRRTKFGSVPTLPTNQGRLSLKEPE